MTDVEHISGKGTAVPVSWFPVPEEHELPENLQGLFKKAREAVGFVPNVFRAYSFRPDFQQGASGSRLGHRLGLDPPSRKRRRPFVTRCAD